MHRNGERAIIENMEGVRRTLALLRAVNVRRGRWFGVSEIATAVGMAKGTTHRYLSVFVDEGILQHTDATGMYAITGSVPMTLNMK